MKTIIEKIKELRKESGAGVQDCRQALEECGENYQQALFTLREKMAREAAKLTDRETAQGWFEVYSHCHGRLVVVVEINTETDFAANSDAVKVLGHEIALQIAAARPVYVKSEEIPGGTLNNLEQRTAAEAEAAGKPEKVRQVMLEGRLKKYRAQHVLLEQPYIKDESITVSQLIGSVSARVGENIRVRRFIRWEMEGAETCG